MKQAGPAVLSHRDILRAYEDLQPGTARRFINDYFAQRDHDRAMERSEQDLRREVVRANHPIVTRGQYFGLLIVLVVIGLAAALGFTGHQQAASVFGGTTIIGLAAVFALGLFAPVTTVRAGPNHL
jgi:uncharacterized membrane protein